MGKQPAFQFYPGDWIQDTRILTPLTRGIWIDMLCFMWRSDDRGKLSGSECQLSRVLSCEKEELREAVAELSVTKIADVTECNGNITVINRRMFREERERKLTRSRVQKFRNDHEKRECNGDVTPPSSSSSSSSNKEIDNTSTGQALPTCPHLKIISEYNKILCPPLRPVKHNLWKGTRSAYLQARWKEDDERQSVEWWTGLFEYIRDGCPFLMGKETKWSADLGWIIKSENMVKILEGKYQKEGNNGGRPAIVESGSGDREHAGRSAGSVDSQGPDQEEQERRMEDST